MMKRCFATAQLLVLVALLPTPAAAQPKAGEALRVAILDFENASTDPSMAPLGKGLQSMLTTDLSQVQTLKLVERQRLKDVQAELSLGASGAVDKTTAAKMGKLAGATHLLAGTFTVVGKTMRIDARLFEVQKGEIKLTAAIEGETDLFFELEKELAGKLLQALGIKMAPKERAAVGKVHTADFAAFKSFSEGINAFDQNRYDEAIAKLKEATTVDAEFSLARMTLDDYETVVAQLRAKAVQMEGARRELERLERLKEVSQDYNVAQKLMQIAADDAPANRRQRITALYLLATGYGKIGNNQGEFMDLRSREDAFAMARMAEAFAASYWAEANAAWPELPLLFTDQFHGGLPKWETFDKDFGYAVKILFEVGADYPENRHNYMVNALRWSWEMAKLLKLDKAQRIALSQLLYKKVKDLGGDDFVENEKEESFVKEYRTALMLDESTALLIRQSNEAKHAQTVKHFAEEIELNKEVKAALEGAKNPEIVREWFLVAQTNKDWQLGSLLSFTKKHFLGDVPDLEGLVHLNRYRKVPHDEYVYIGDHPLWAVQGAYSNLVTDRRPKDPYRANAIRYYIAQGERVGPDTIVVLDGKVKSDLEARFTLDYAPAEDWCPSNSREAEKLDRDEIRKEGKRPLVAFVFGLTNVATEKDKDPQTDKYLVTRPMSSHLVVIDPEGVELVRSVESKRGSWNVKEEFQWTSLGREKLKGELASRQEISVKVKGGKVAVKVGKRTFDFQTQAEATGFYGFQIRGPGYVEISAPGIR
jgi:TolB-like protein